MRFRKLIAVFRWVLIIRGKHVSKESLRQTRRITLSGPLISVRILLCQLALERRRMETPKEPPAGKEAQLQHSAPSFTKA